MADFPFPVFLDSPFEGGLRGMLFGRAPDQKRQGRAFHSNLFEAKRISAEFILSEAEGIPHANYSPEFHICLIFSQITTFPPPHMRYSPSHTRYCTPHTRYCTPHTRYCAPHTRYCAPHTRYCAPHTRYCAPPTRYCAPPTRYCAPHTRYCAPQTRYSPSQIRYSPSQYSILNTQ